MGSPRGTCANHQPRSLGWLADKVRTCAWASRSVSSPAPPTPSQSQGRDREVRPNHEACSVSWLAGHFSREASCAGPCQDLAPHPAGARQSLCRCPPPLPGEAALWSPLAWRERSTQPCWPQLTCPAQPAAHPEPGKAPGPPLPAPTGAKFGFHKFPRGLSGHQAPSRPLGTQSRLSADTRGTQTSS